MVAEFTREGGEGSHVRVDPRECIADDISPDFAMERRNAKKGTPLKPASTKYEKILKHTGMQIRAK